MDLAATLETIDALLAEASAQKLLAEWFWTDRWGGSDGFLLPLEARGLYREMLTQAWRRRARLPKDPEAIRRAVGCTDVGGCLVNKTQLEVYLVALQGAVEKKERARAAANARWSRRGGDAQAHADAHAQALPGHVLEECPPSPSPSPSPSLTPPRSSPPPRPARTAPGTRKRSLEASVDRIVTFASGIGHRFDRASRRALRNRLKGGESEEQVLAPFIAQKRTLEGLEADRPDPPREPPERQRRQDGGAWAAALEAYWNRLAGDRIDGPTAEQLAGWSAALEAGRLTLEQVQGSICERVREELIVADCLGRDEPWPPPGLAPYDAHGPPGAPLEAGAAGQGRDPGGGG
jgi:hypothetical protein